MIPTPPPSNSRSTNNTQKLMASPNIKNVNSKKIEKIKNPTPPAPAVSSNLLGVQEQAYPEKVERHRQTLAATADIVDGLTRHRVEDKEQPRQQARSSRSAKQAGQPADEQRTRQVQGEIDDMVADDVIPAEAEPYAENMVEGIRGNQEGTIHPLLRID